MPDTPPPDSPLDTRSTRAATEIAALLIRTGLDAGGDGKDVLRLLESVVLGVLSTMVEPRHDGTVLDILDGNLRRRLSAARLLDALPAGRA